MDKYITIQFTVVMNYGRAIDFCNSILFATNVYYLLNEFNSHFR